MLDRSLRISRGLYANHFDVTKHFPGCNELTRVAEQVCVNVIEVPIAFAAVTYNRCLHIWPSGDT